MADSVLKASDNDKSVYLDPVNLVKSQHKYPFQQYFDRIFLKKNLRNIIGANFLALFWPKSRTTSVKTNTKTISLPPW